MINDLNGCDRTLTLLFDAYERALGSNPNPSSLIVVDAVNEALTEVLRCHFAQVNRWHNLGRRIPIMNFSRLVPYQCVEDCIINMLAKHYRNDPYISPGRFWAKYGVQAFRGWGISKVAMAIGCKEFPQTPMTSHILMAKWPWLNAKENTTTLSMKPEKDEINLQSLEGTARLIATNLRIEPIEIDVPFPNGENITPQGLYDDFKHMCFTHLSPPSSVSVVSVPILRLPRSGEAASLTPEYYSVEAVWIDCPLPDNWIAWIEHLSIFLMRVLPQLGVEAGEEAGERLGIIALETKLGHEVSKCYVPVLPLVEKLTQESALTETVVDISQIVKAALSYGAIQTPTTLAYSLLPQDKASMVALAWQLYLIRDVLGESFSYEILCELKNEFRKLWAHVPTVNLDVIFFNWRSSLPTVHINVKTRTTQLLLILLSNAMKHHYEVFNLKDACAKRIRELAQFLDKCNGRGPINVEVQCPPNNSVSGELVLQVSNWAADQVQLSWSKKKGTPQAVEWTCRAILEGLKRPYAGQEFMDPPVIESGRCLLKVHLDMRETNL